jgi:hypothetical protein
LGRPASGDGGTPLSAGDVDRLFAPIDPDTGGDGDPEDDSAPYRA